MCAFKFIKTTSHTNCEAPHYGIFCDLSISSLRYKYSPQIPIFICTRGPGQLLPSYSASVLQYGSGSFSVFLVQILGVDTPLFLHNAEFSLSCSLLLCKRSHTYVDCKISVGSMFFFVAGDWVQYPVKYFYKNSFRHIKLRVTGLQDSGWYL
jgi:hypothetical protein